MSRFPPKPTSQLADDVRPYGEIVDSTIQSSFGENDSIMTYRDDHGSLICPFAILLASKEIGKQLLSVSRAFTSLEGFPSDAKEVTILTVGAKFQTAYERYAHKLVGIKVAGLSQRQVDLLAQGQRPEGLSEAANIAYDATNYLVNQPGPLPADLYNAAVKAFGTDGALAMAHYTAVYCYVSRMADSCSGSSI